MKEAAMQTQLTKSWDCLSQFVPVLVIIQQQHDLIWQAAGIRHRQGGGRKADSEASPFRQYRVIHFSIHSCNQ